MDNVTHSLIGAVLGQAGLKNKTGLAMPTLIIAANIPDIDATCTLLGTVSLAMRRGITHGPIATAVLPLVLAGITIWFDRWQARRGKRPEGRLPVRPGWVVALAYLGCLSHPLFDWMNSYGIRLLEPFSSRWYYGDALFIVDPWLLAMLICGVWLAQRRQRAKRGDWRQPAWAAIGGVTVYVMLNLGISASAAAGVRALVPTATQVVATPVPFEFWRREVMVRTPNLFGSYHAIPFLALKGEATRPIGMNDPRITQRLPGNREAQAFLFWSRMPVAEAQGDTILLKDQRFLGRGLGPFTVALEP